MLPTIMENEPIETEVGDVEVEARPKTEKPKPSFQYPHVWFERNPNGKPSITIKKSTMNLKNMRLCILKGLQNGDLDRDLAKIFLVKFGQTITEQLDSKWESYGVLIGDKNEDVSPLSLLTVNEVDYGRYMGQVPPDYDEPDWNILIAILFIYRANRVSLRVDVPSQMMNRLKKQIQGKGIVYQNLHQLTEYKFWQSDEDYHKLVGAYDMFFHRFPHSRYSGARFGTLPSQYKDCGALFCVTNFCKATRLPTGKLSDWIFTTESLDELERLLEPNNIKEIESVFSYFPYQTDFGLVTKSAYSTVINPNIYFTIHAACTLLAIQDSINARLIIVDNHEDLMKNAIIIGYAFHSKIKIFTTDRQDDAADNTEGLNKEEFQSTDGSEWFAYMSSKNFELTTEMKDFVKRRQINLFVRNGTVGKYVKDYVID